MIPKMESDNDKEGMELDNARIPIAAGLCHVVMHVSLFCLFCLNHLGTKRELFVIAVLETETGNLQYHLNCMQSTK